MGRKGPGGVILLQGAQSAALPLPAGPAAPSADTERRQVRELRGVPSSLAPMRCLPGLTSERSMKEGSSFID